VNTTAVLGKLLDLRVGLAALACKAPPIHLPTSMNGLPSQGQQIPLSQRGSSQEGNDPLQTANHSLLLFHLR
jgi:hypothetical protein